MNKSLLERSFVVVSLLSIVPPVHGQSEWPEFRAPTAQGHAASAPKTWDIEKGVAWKIPTEARGWSSPVVSDGRIDMTEFLQDFSTSGISSSSPTR